LQSCNHCEDLNVDGIIILIIRIKDLGIDVWIALNGFRRGQRRTLYTVINIGVSEKAKFCLLAQTVLSYRG